MNYFAGLNKRRHRHLIEAEKRKLSRSNFWKSIIAKELSIILAIVWYIKVDLLRTKQLPPYVTFSRIDMIPTLKRDIEQQATKVFADHFRNKRNAIKFHVQDTSHKHLDGKEGVILCYDQRHCRYLTEVSDRNQRTKSGTSQELLSPENMEPCDWERVKRKGQYPSISMDGFPITLSNHFTRPTIALPTVMFWPSVFTEIGGISGCPYRGGQLERDRLIKLIDEKEAMEEEKRKKIQEQQMELEKGLARLYSTRTPIESRPRKKSVKLRG